MLLTASAQGDRVCISVTDDIPNADPAVRRAGMRGLMERVALRGGALDVDVRPAEGTTMTLRLSGVGEDRQDVSLAEPVKGAVHPLIPVVSCDMTR